MKLSVIEYIINGHEYITHKQIYLCDVHTPKKKKQGSVDEGEKKKQATT